MTTILLWSFDGLAALLAGLHEVEAVRWTVFATSGRKKNLRLTSATEYVEKNEAFWLVGSWAGGKMRLVASPGDVTAKASHLHSVDRAWSDAYDSFQSTTDYRNTFAVKKFPATLNAWLDGDVHDALAWAKEHLREFALLRGGILAKHELLSGPDMVSPNPWLVPSLAAFWPRDFDIYIASSSSPDADYLRAISNDEACVGGVHYMSIESSQIKQRILDIKQYADIASANRRFREQLGPEPC